MSVHAGRMIVAVSSCVRIRGNVGASALLRFPCRLMLRASTKTETPVAFWQEYRVGSSSASRPFFLPAQNAHTYCSRPSMVDLGIRQTRTPPSCVTCSRAQPHANPATDDSHLKVAGLWLGRPRRRRERALQPLKCALHRCDRVAEVRGAAVQQLVAVSLLQKQARPRRERQACRQRLRVVDRGVADAQAAVGANDDERHGRGLREVWREHEAVPREVELV